MKTKSIVIIVALLFSSTLFADVVSFKTPEVNGRLNAPAIKLTDWQAVMSCHFDHNGVRKESIRYPQTWVKKINEIDYSLKVKKGSLSEMLPGWRLLTCAYKLILIGKKDNGKTAFGEIYLLGQEFGEMDEIDLNDLQNKEWVAKVLTEKTAEIKLGLSVDGGIVAE